MHFGLFDFNIFRPFFEIEVEFCKNSFKIKTFLYLIIISIKNLIKMNYSA